MSTNDLMHPLNCACFNARRTARLVTQHYDRALKPSGIPATQFSLLAMLGGIAGDQGVPLTSLASSLGMDRTTLTRNLSLVERKGWIETLPGEDRRERLVRLTATGRDKLNETMPYWQQAQQEIVALLGTNSVNNFLELTRKLAAT